MYLTSQWLIIFSITVSQMMLKISPSKIKGKIYSKFNEKYWPTWKNRNFQGGVTETGNASRTPPRARCYYGRGSGGGSRHPEALEYLVQILQSSNFHSLHLNFRKSCIIHLIFIIFIKFYNMHNMFVVTA